MNALIWIILLSLAPFAEVRASIPYGIFVADLPLFIVIFVSVISNILVAPISYFILHFIVDLFRRFAFFDRFWSATVIRSQRKVHPYVEKYGVFGLALFIGIPFPGTGVYTAAVGAYALGLSFRKFFIASVFGVCIAAALVTLISLFGRGAWLWFINVG